MTGHTHDHPHTHDHGLDVAHRHPHPHGRSHLGHGTTDGVFPVTELSDDALDALLEVAYADRTAATARIVVIVEEQIARAVAAEMPAAATVALYEDRSHDAPHAHVRAVLDADGTVLADGTGDWWHDQDWTGTIDELVWDLYHLDPSGFRTVDGVRVREIPLGGQRRA